MYQAVIIGFGKGGKTLAAHLAKTGWQVALIEQSPEMYGGTCINTGCIPVKTLVHDAQTGHIFKDAMQRKSAVVDFLREKNYLNLAAMDNVTIINGRAEFIDPHTVRVIRQEDEEIIHGEKFFINTGAQAVIPDIAGISTTPGVYDSNGLLKLDELPGRLGILGGGYIGIEFATMFAQFGSKVTVFEANSRFLPREDADISAAVASELKAQGVDLLMGARIERITAEHGEVQLHTANGLCAVDVLLVSSGRAPATHGLQLQNAGVAVDSRGAVVVDAYLKTTADHIWALGDVNGGLQFTYISLDDYRIVRDQLTGTGKRHTGHRQNVPYSVFMTPVLSRVGLSEEQARQSGADIAVANLPAAAIPRTRIMNDTRGLLKAIIDRKSGKVLGVSLFCVDSHEMINIVKTVMDAGLPYTVLRDQIFTHPTMSEALNDLFSQFG